MSKNVAEFVEEEAIFLRSKTGKGNIVMADRSGFVYWKKTKEDLLTGRTYWMCSETRKLKCPSRVTTKGNRIVSRRAVHIHEPLQTYVDAVQQYLTT